MKKLTIHQPKCIPKPRMFNTRGLCRSQPKTIFTHDLTAFRNSDWYLFSDWDSYLNLVCSTLEVYVGGHTQKYFRHALTSLRNFWIISLWEFLRDLILQKTLSWKVVIPSWYDDFWFRLTTKFQKSHSHLRNFWIISLWEFFRSRSILKPRTIMSRALCKPCRT